ncbi:MarR family winged helix-turn-helix transcriptional regulator [Methylomarinovum caldicuralii]|nr:MarR family winged helix-turn-helix transcriptional regulator [Methylomarinovum caldicuralii]
MKTAEVYKYLERIGNLLRAEIRQGDAKLQPVQLEILHYLSICNRHSNIPAAVTEYLGLTKGTVSQTLTVLENKGLIEKVPDAQDRRVIHLFLTEKGKAVVDASLPPATLDQGLSFMAPEAREQLARGLAALLEGMQAARQYKAFGVCSTCAHLRETETGHRCDLTGLPLEAGHLQQICREFLPTAKEGEKAA